MKVHIKKQHLEPIQDALIRTTDKIDQLEEQIARIEKEPFHADLEEEGKRNHRIEILQAWIRDLSKEEDELDEIITKLKKYIMPDY